MFGAHFNAMNSQLTAVAEGFATYPNRFFTQGTGQWANYHIMLARV